MKFRKKIFNKRKDSRKFGRSEGRVNPKNSSSYRTIRRGGIRL